MCSVYNSFGSENNLFVLCVCLFFPITLYLAHRSTLSTHYPSFCQLCVYCSYLGRDLGWSMHGYLCIRLSVSDCLSFCLTTLSTSSPMSLLLCLLPVFYSHLPVSLSLSFTHILSLSRYFSNSCSHCFLLLHYYVINKHVNNFIHHSLSLDTTILRAHDLSFCPLIFPPTLTDVRSLQVANWCWRVAVTAYLLPRLSY